jgi:hypothetical protein
MLGICVAVGADDAPLTTYLDRLYDAFPRAAAAEHEYRIGRSAGDRFALFTDHVPVSEAIQPEALVGTLVNHLNRQVATKTEHVVIHAGGAECNGTAVVMPAHMEHGKSTLTTGLVRAGFRYVTDEAVAIRRDTHEIVPYPKPITLDQGSWQLFPELEPDEAFPSEAYKASQWQVPPSAIRPDAVAPPCSARFIVFPEYDEEHTTELIPMSRAEGLVELAKNTFRFDDEGRATLDVLAAVMETAEAYRLPNGDLDQAVAAITALVG